MKVVRHDLRLDSSNVMDVLAPYDVIVDGCDNFTTKYLVNDAAVLSGKTNVYGSIYRFDGQASIFVPGKGPCYRCLFPEPTPTELAPSCDEAGVLGVLPGVIGLIQATEAIKAILGAGTPLVGRLLTYDALAMTFKEYRCAATPAAPSAATRRPSERSPTWRGPATSSPGLGRRPWRHEPGDGGVSSRRSPRSSRPSATRPSCASSWTGSPTVSSSGASASGSTPAARSRTGRPCRSSPRESAAGRSAPGKTIIDSSSGNTAVGLALVGRAKGYPVELVMPASVSEDRKRLCRAYGARITITDAFSGSDGALLAVRERVAAAPQRYFYADQYRSPANPLAHYRTTGPEIWEQTGGRITHFVAGLGTSGTIMGTGRFLHERNPRVRVVAVEPDEPLHGLEGMKHMASAIVPEIYDPIVHDDKLSASTENAYEVWCETLGATGLLVGHSAAAALWAGREVARSLSSGVVVVLLPDGGERYLAPGGRASR